MYKGSTVLQSADPRGRDVLEAGQSVEVDTFCETVEPEMRWEVAGVVILPVRVNVRLKCGNSIRVVRVLDSSKECAASHMVRVVKVHLRLKPKVQEVCLGIVEDVRGIQPEWRLNRDDGVEAGDRQFQDAPEVVKTIVGLVAYSSECGVDARGEGPGDEAWEEVHEGMATCCVATCAQAGDAKSLKPIFEKDTIKRHDAE